MYNYKYLYWKRKSLYCNNEIWQIAYEEDSMFVVFLKNKKKKKKYFYINVKNCFVKQTSLDIVKQS